MIIRILFLIFLWLLLRRLWRVYLVSRTRSTSGRRPYPGPQQPRSAQPSDLKDITEQEIAEADFEELDDR